MAGAATTGIVVGIVVWKVEIVVFARKVGIIVFALHINGVRLEDRLMALPGSSRPEGSRWKRLFQTFQRLDHLALP